MQPIHILFTFYFARYMVPMTIFMTPYLIEKKKFTNKEIFNNITPFFFIASLFANIIGPIIVEKIGNRNTILFETSLELVCYLIFNFMPERSFLGGRITGILHGIVTSLASLTKGILMSVMPPSYDKKAMFRNHNSIKKLCGVLSSWMGQDLKYSTGEHKASLIFSFITLIISLIICLFIPDDHKRTSKINLLGILTSGNFISEVRKLYNNRKIFFSILQIIGSTLYISFAMFSSFMFIERKKDVDPNAHSFSKFMYFLSFPLRYLNKFFLDILHYFDSSIMYNPSYDKNTIIFGYIDGIAKLFSILLATILDIMITKFEMNITSEMKGMVTGIIVMISTYGMGKVDTLVKSYLLFVVGSVSSQICFLAAYNGLAENTVLIHLYLGIGLTISCLIHIIISYFSKYMNYNSSKRMIVYFYINLSLVILGMAIWKKGIDDPGLEATN